MIEATDGGFLGESRAGEIPQMLIGRAGSPPAPSKAKFLGAYPDSSIFKIPVKKLTYLKKSTIFFA